MMSKHISIANSGKTISEEQKEKLRMKTPWNKGKVGVMSSNARQKISLARLNSSMSEYTKEKIRQSVKLNIHSEETRKKMSISAKNRSKRSYTPEQRERISLAMKESWIKRKK